MRNPSIHVSSRRARLAAALVLVLPVATCPGATGTATQTLNALIYPIAKLSVPASVTLTSGSTQFSPFQASLPITYRARTTPTGGGTMTVQVTSDFTPAGGPSAASGVLTYTCSSANLGTACSGIQTASTTIQTPVLTLPASACTGGGGTCSASDPNSLTLNFTVVDDPSYATGSYSAKVTFTISAT
jgi:hypothetical protein